MVTCAHAAAVAVHVKNATTMRVTLMCAMIASESYSSSGEDTTDSDYDGDNEDDDDSMKCQPAARISSQYSNKTLRLIHVHNVGLFMMAVRKAE